MDIKKELPEAVNAGCSAMTWETKDGKQLWGRNFDFNRIAAESGIICLPEGLPFYGNGTKPENSLDESSRLRVKYAAAGTGSVLLEGTPVLFEGINEEGLMGGQLYYRELAAFPEKIRQNTIPLQPAFAVTCLLTQCGSVKEILERLEKDFSLASIPIFGSVPSVHWMFSDRTGEAVVLEPDRDGIRVYRNSMGVLTNSPGYDWHCRNLLNYPHIKNEEAEAMNINGLRLKPCFSGSGGAGLPGDFTSPSRFVRLAFLKNFCEKGEDELQGVTRMFRILQNVAFPLGMVRVGQTQELTEHDVLVSPYDYTVYTAVMCAQSLRIYWNTYDNPQIRSISLRELKRRKEVVQIPLHEQIRIPLME